MFSKFKFLNSFFFKDANMFFFEKLDNEIPRSLETYKFTEFPNIHDPKLYHEL